jgi:hypothetical protein
MLNATFNNISAISWQSILLVDETEVRQILTTECRLKYQATETTKIQKGKDYDGL